VSARLRLLLACLATAVLLVPVGWLWWSSLMPEEYSVMEMGYVDLGGGPEPAAHAGHVAQGTGAGGSHTGTDISTLVAADGPADVRLDLTARAETFRLASGESYRGFTFNGGSPGPTVRATEGDLVEVRVHNDNVADGVTVHWHGVDVPNAMDGVAGVTQDAVPPGDSFTYRFVADQAGTYWYHSHQLSHEQVRGGLFGAVVVDPAQPARSPSTEPVAADVLALVHVYGAHRTLNGAAGDTPVEVAAGERVRVRVVNTDNGPMTTWVSGAGFRVVAVDGTDLVGPETVEDRSVVVTAGGRVDLEVDVPAAGARVELGGNAVVLGPSGSTPGAEPRPGEFVDLLSYGSPGEDSAVERLRGVAPDRTFDYVIDRRPGFHQGRPGIWWTVNGRMWPDVPMFTVTSGDVVRMHIRNDSGEVHPMHLHGHHALVLSRDGAPATGSPWWVDSLNVAHGEEYVVAFVADNPGIWMDHCHNLPHAAEGLVAHLMYAGHDTPFRIGGRGGNEPE
jgi:FtsP/CotA-like multicopper oxidase with cupredoxin domain